jgi:hypothetical protein
MIKIYPHAFDFMMPLCAGAAEFVATPEEADCVLSMNNAGPEGMDNILQAKRLARGADIPFCFWTIEDPNSFLFYLPEAEFADYVFTSDRELLPEYREHLRHDRVFWLPLAANPALHRPLPLAEDATDFVFSGNWYPYGARKWGDETIILPLARAGYSITCFSYERPCYPELADSWRQLIGPPEGPFESVPPGDPKNGGTSCYTTAEQYRHGRVVLGNNNQRSGLDGIERTVMTSMRTFEALACGKAFLTTQSDAYDALGLAAHAHLAVSETPLQTLKWAEALLDPNNGAQILADQGREKVLANHTYAHRLERIGRALQGEADPEDWR